VFNEFVHLMSSVDYFHVILAGTVSESPIQTAGILSSGASLERKSLQQRLGDKVSTAVVSSTTPDDALPSGSKLGNIKNSSFLFANSVGLLIRWGHKGDIFSI